MTSCCIVTAYDGAHERLTEVTLESIAAHARRHGHALVLAHETDLGVHFDYSIKVNAMRALLPDHDAAIWVDADCVILDDAPDLAGLVADWRQPTTNPVVGCRRSSREPISHWMAVGFRGTLYASCLWALRRDPRSLALLDELWRRRDREMLDTSWFGKLGAPGDGVGVLSVQKFPLALISSSTGDEWTSTGVVHAATGQGNYLDITAASLRAVREAHLAARSDPLDVMLALQGISDRHPWPADHLSRSESEHSRRRRHRLSTPT